VEDITGEDSHADLGRHLIDFVAAGDRILFKASHSVELNRVVQKFRADFGGE
jgi:UDP-N-acetylmuramoyl-tripeptide--D-alanyl-D-alanine ligase